jgi:predicted aspartyl protease
MIRRYIDESGMAMVNVTVGGIRSQITIPALVDTGFDGYVCLPIALAVNRRVRVGWFPFS